MICLDREILTTTVVSFRDRARRLRRSAIVFLLTILAVLATGIAIFVFAGELANREVRSALVEARKDALSVIESSLREVEQELLKSEEEIKYYSLEFRAELTGGRGTPGIGPRAAILRDRLDYAERRHEERRRSLDNLRATHRKAQEQLAAAIEAPHDTQLSTLVSAIVTRVGTVVLLLFLVQILVPLYKYNCKLAGYYEARGDALAVLDLTRSPEPEDLERIVTAFSPDSVGFEKPPATPTQQATELARHVLATRNRTS